MYACWALLASDLGICGSLSDSFVLINTSILPAVMPDLYFLSSWGQILTSLSRRLAGFWWCSQICLFATAPAPKPNLLWPTSHVLPPSTVRRETLFALKLTKFVISQSFSLICCSFCHHSTPSSSMQVRSNQNCVLTPRVSAVPLLSYNVLTKVL